jgi:hypothetical protein
MCRNLSVRKERLTVQFFIGNFIPSKYRIEEWVRLPHGTIYFKEKRFMEGKPKRKRNLKIKI